MAAGTVTVSKDKLGNWVYTFNTTSPAAVPVDDSSDLDLEKITKTVSSIKAWLKTKPPLDDVSLVVEYEKSNADRSSTVGSSGCLTLYLEGD